MVFLLILLWLASGVFGAFLIWRDLQIIDFNYPICPSPKVVVTWIAVSPFGGVLFVGGGLIWAVNTWENFGRHSDSWWTRPICGKRQ